MPCVYRGLETDQFTSSMHLVVTKVYSSGLRQVIKHFVYRDLDV